MIGNPKTKTIKSEIMEYLEALVIAVALAAFIITFIAQAFHVQGDSMQNTLHNGERLLINKLVYRYSEPKRGDIIVFKYPQDPKRRFIKRVIAIPGDTVLIDNGKLYVNNELKKENYIKEQDWSAEFGEHRYVNSKVPKGHVFVMGDNRNNSRDSRFPDVGMVPKKNIIGEAFLRFWPLNKIGYVHMEGWSE